MAGKVVEPGSQSVSEINSCLIKKRESPKHQSYGYLLSQALLERNEKLSYGGISAVRNKLLNHWQQGRNRVERLWKKIKWLLQFN